MKSYCHYSKAHYFLKPLVFYNRLSSIFPVFNSRQFRKEKFSEPPPKSPHWKPVEEKVLWKTECRELESVCLSLRNRGQKESKQYLIRNWFMVELGLFTGLRVMEMANLKIKDLIIHSEHSTVVVREGKGRKRRDVWINSKFKKTCLKFLRIREKLGFRNAPDNYLLVSDKGLPLTTRALEKAFKKCLAEAGLSSSYSIHSLRHTYATFSLDAGVDIRFLKEQMGHSTIKTTELYLSLLQEKNRLALERLYKASGKK